MKTYEFEPNRSDALRKQLVEMPTQSLLRQRMGERPAGQDTGLASMDPELNRRPHRTRRVLITVAAASLGVFFIGSDKYVDPECPCRRCPEVSS